MQKRVWTSVIALAIGLSGAIAASRPAPVEAPKAPAFERVKSTGLAALPIALPPLVDSVAVAAAAAPVAMARRKGALPGVNISGGEFGTVPGRLGHQYAYPTNAEIDFYYAQGMKILRMPFRWERLQPNLYGALVPADRAALRAAVTRATGKGMTVVLDMHDYARRRATPAATEKSFVGSAAVSASALSDAWTRIAADYRDNPKVWLGLMNEPNGLPGASWWRSIQQVTDDLRGQRITNKLLIPGISWTGAHSWASSGNAAHAERFVDPMGNFAFELHQYLDSDSSGTHTPCKRGAAARVDRVLAWAHVRKVQLFFGEIAASGDPQCLIEYPLMLGKLNASPAVIGWTAWGAGRWWNATYMFRLAPVTTGVPTPHMLMLQASMIAN